MTDVKLCVPCWQLHRWRNLLLCVLAPNRLAETGPVSTLQIYPTTEIEEATFSSSDLKLKLKEAEIPKHADVSADASANPFPLIGGYPYPSHSSTGTSPAFSVPRPFDHRGSPNTSETNWLTVVKVEPGTSREVKNTTVTIEDIIIGTGEAVKIGSHVIIWYICTVLETGFVFDRCTTPDGSAVGPNCTQSSHSSV